MKKRLIAVLLALVMLVSVVVGAGASTVKQDNAADALNHLGLFLGKGGSAGYALDDPLNRAETVILLVRMLGKVEEATAGGDFDMPFEDARTWKGGYAKGYIGYVWKNDITKGVGQDENGVERFAPDRAMTDYMFLTLILRIFGYVDTGASPEFFWKTPYELAADVGLIDTAEAFENFDRGDAVEIFWNALSVKFKGTGETLAQRLISQGVFTAGEYAEAKDIWSGSTQSGDNSGSTVPSNPGTTIPPVVDGGDDGDDTIVVDANTPPTAEAYEAYQAMSGQAQMEFFEQFDDPMDFFAWLNAAKEAYEAAHPDIEIGDDGVVDLGKQP